MRIKRILDLTNTVPSYKQSAAAFLAQNTTHCVGTSNPVVKTTISKRKQILPRTPCRETNQIDLNLTGKTDILAAVLHDELSTSFVDQNTISLARPKTLGVLDWHFYISDLETAQASMVIIDGASPIPTLAALNEGMLLYNTMNLQNRDVNRVLQEHPGKYDHLIKDGVITPPVSQHRSAWKVLADRAALTRTREQRWRSWREQLS